MKGRMYPCRFARAPVKRSGAFTLIEIMLVIGLTGLFLATAAPAFKTSIRRMMFSDLVNSAADLCRSARAAAISSGTTYAVECRFGHSQSFILKTWSERRDSAGRPLRPVAYRRVTLMELKVPRAVARLHDLSPGHRPRKEYIFTSDGMGNSRESMAIQFFPAYRPVRRTFTLSRGDRGEIELIGK